MQTYDAVWLGSLEYEGAGVYSLEWLVWGVVKKAYRGKICNHVLPQVSGSNKPFLVVYIV